MPPWLHLKGVSIGDFSEALQPLLGPNCPGLSASTVTRLKQVWEDEYRQWARRDLSDQRHVYLGGWQGQNAVMPRNECS